MCHCFVINLEKQEKRREIISKQLNALHIPFEIFPAVNGRLLTQEQISQLYDREKALKKGYYDLTLPEIGCALSHINIYKKIVSENIPYALILEDDAFLNPELPKVLLDLKNKINKNNPQVVLLSHVRRYQSNTKTRLNEHFDLATIYGCTAGAHGYFITYAAAKALLSYLLPIWVVADRWEYISEYNIAHVSAILPYEIGLTADSFVSSIQLPENRERKFRPVSYFLKKIFYKNIFYRLFVVPFWHVKKQDKPSYINNKPFSDQ